MGIKIESHNEYPEINFNTPYNSMIALMVFILGDDWHTVLYDHTKGKGTTWPATLYFLFLFVFFNLIMNSLF